MNKQGTGDNLYYKTLNIIDVSTLRLSDHMKWRLVATEGWELRNVITNNVIWTTQKTESSVYRLQRARAWFDVTCFPAFVGPNVISYGPASILTIRHL